MGLTKRQVERAEHDPDGPSWQFLADEDVSGFGVRLYPSGRKTFAIRYRFEGRKKYLALGQFGKLTVQQARKLAREKFVMIANGVDPAKEREHAPTLKEFSKVYIKRHAKPHKKSWKDDQYRIDSRLLPKFGSYRLDELDVDELAEEHARQGRDSPYEANRAFQLLRNMLNRARKWGHLPSTYPNPAAEISWFNEKSRDRWLRPDEVERLLTEVDKEEDPYFAPAVRLYLLTGLRRTELLSARWEHVDLERGELRLPETKSGRAQVRPLSSAAIELLERLPRERESPYLFPSPRLKDDHRKDFKNEWNAARERADLEDVNLHDLRRTAGSWMAQNGVPLQVIQEVLGHSHPAVTRLYARLSSEQESDAVETLGDALATVPGLLPGESGAEEVADDAEEQGAAPLLKAILDGGGDPDALRALADLLEAKNG